MPGTLIRRSSASRQAGVPRTTVSLSSSIYSSWAFKGGKYTIDALEGATDGEHAPAVALGPDHLDELTAARHQFAQQPGLLVGERPRRWVHPSAK